MLTETIVKQAFLDELSLGPWVSDPDSETLWTGVTIEDDDGMETEFEVQIQEVVVSTAEGSETYLVMAWVVVPPGEMGSDPENRPALLTLLDDLNGEPGVKFRVQAGPDGERGLVCEADLPAEFVTPAWLFRSFVRCREVVTKFFDDLQQAARA